MIFSGHKQIAIRRPVVEKLEGKLDKGIARITQRINLVEAEVLMNHKLANGTALKPGDKIILRGDVIMQSWAQNVFVYKDMEMVFCPEDLISGYNTSDAT